MHLVSFFFTMLQVKDCGMKFRWNMFGMTSGDAQIMAECVKYSGKLRSLTLHQRYGAIVGSPIERLALDSDRRLSYTPLSFNAQPA